MNAENIEIINDVKVDWNLYKGSNIKRSKNSYINFCNIINEVDFELKSDFINSSEKITLQYRFNKNIKLNILPDNFKRNTYKALKEIINNTNGDKFIRISKMHESNAVQELYLEMKESKFNTKIEIRMCNYNAFVKARNSTYKYCDDNDLIYLSPYLSNRQGMLIDFKCGHKPRFVLPSNFKKGQGCLSCAGKCKEQAKDGFQIITEKEGYKILGEYTEAHAKVDMMCPNGHIWSISPNKFKQGRRCGECAMSSGEQRASKVLDNLNIDFIYNKPFPGMIGEKALLRPDFYIPELNLIIEIDGVQHYKEVSIWGGKEALERQQNSDKLKDDYCKKFNIDIIRIADNNKQLEEIIVKAIEDKRRIIDNIKK